MTLNEEWDTVAEQIRTDGGPWRSRATARLFELAEKDGWLVLASHRKAVGDDTVTDVIRDLLTAKIDALVNHPNPRACFRVAIRRAMISYRRRGDSRVQELEPGGEIEDGARGGHENVAAASAQFVLDGRALLARLSDRDRQIVQAVATGEDPADVARHNETSRDNVYKIVSRLRKQWDVSQKGSSS